MIWSLLRYRSRLFLAAAICAPEALGQQPGQCTQMDQVLFELKQLREMIATLGPQKDAPRRVKLNVGDAPALGSKHAALTIVTFTDYQCSFCQQFYQRTFPDLKKLFIDTGKVRFYSLDRPIESHRNAMVAALAGRCAAEQNAFWSVHEQMRSNTEKLDLSDLIRYGEHAGVDVPRFRQCIDSQKYKDAIAGTTAAAASVGANGTPSFVVGRSTSEGVEGELVIGAVPFGVFEQILGQLKP
jgi:protein-disulfide isomerase